jgi:hypothetical protein
MVLVWFLYMFIFSIQVFAGLFPLSLGMPCHVFKYSSQSKCLNIESCTNRDQLPNTYRTRLFAGCVDVGPRGTCNACDPAKAYACGRRKPSLIYTHFSILTQPSLSSKNASPFLTSCSHKFKLAVSVCLIPFLPRSFIC